MKYSSALAALSALIPAALIPAALAPGVLAAQTLVDGRRSIVLDGNAAQVVVDLAGGSIVRFQFQDQQLDPLNWAEEGDKRSPRAMSHFICLDRWGAPSEAELNNGMPFHGEAATLVWRVDQKPNAAAGVIEAEMSASLPMAGFDVKRWMRLHDDNALLLVKERVTNRNRLGRVYNWVQHPSIGPPFLDESVVVDANARAGFAQGNPMPHPEQPVVYWPQALYDGQPVNLRYLTSDHNPNVVSFTIDEEFGWTTAANAAQGLLIGYLWKTAEYPWLNIWRRVTAGGKPQARGLEFGTTGLHQPFGVLTEKGRIFGRRLFAYLDSGESVTKYYAAFLVKIPSDYRGVAAIAYDEHQIVLIERDNERRLTIESGNIFGW